MGDAIVRPGRAAARWRAGDGLRTVLNGNRGATGFAPGRAVAALIAPGCPGTFGLPP